MKNLKPVFDLAHLTKENGMKDSMEYIVQEASKTSQVYMNEKLGQIQSNLDSLKISMVFDGDYSRTKNQVHSLETKFSILQDTSEILDRKIQELKMDMTNFVTVNVFRKEIESIRFSLKRVRIICVMNL